MLEAAGLATEKDGGRVGVGVCGWGRASRMNEDEGKGSEVRLGEMR